MTLFQPQVHVAPCPTTLERRRLVAAARLLYLPRGMAAVSMADVARAAYLPESAINKHFASKELLVAAVVDAHAQTIHDTLCRHRERCTSAVEELLVLRNWASEEMQPLLLPFFQQLAADYPASQRRWQEHLAGFPVAHLHRNLHWGVQQGLYWPDLDVAANVRSWFRRTSLLRTAAGLDRGDMHRALLERFLAELVTPLGAFVARRLQEAYPFY